MKRKPFVARAEHSLEQSRDRVLMRRVLRSLVAVDRLLKRSIGRALSLFQKLPLKEIFILKEQYNLVQPALQ